MSHYLPSDRVLNQVETVFVKKIYLCTIKIELQLKVFKDIDQMLWPNASD